MGVYLTDFLFNLQRVPSSDLGRISLGVCTCFLGYYLTHFLFNLERFSFETRGRLSLESRRIHGVVFL